MAADQPAAVELSGLATVAALAFLAARTVPGGFVVALVGGVPLARASQRGGLREGSATAAASLVETIALMGPARLIVPLPHVLTAPLLGVLERRRARLVILAAAGAAVRLLLYLASFGLYIFVLVGAEAFLGTYAELRQVAGWLPAGLAGAVWAVVVFNAAWSAVGGTVQAWVVRRGLRKWPATDPVAAPGDPAPAAAGHLDGRAVIGAGAVAFTAAIATTDPVVLAVVAVWLIGAWVLGRAGLRALLSGLGLAVPLAASTAGFAVVAGLPGPVVAARAARVVLLVVTAMWLRAAAGPAGLRAASIRLVRRLGRAPTLSLAGRVLAESAGSADYRAAIRRLADRLRAAGRRPSRLLDATLRWTAKETGRRPTGRLPALELCWGRTETGLCASAAIMAAPAAMVVLG